MITLHTWLCMYKPTITIRSMNRYNASNRTPHTKLVPKKCDDTKNFDKKLWVKDRNRVADYLGMNKQSIKLLMMVVVSGHLFSMGITQEPLYKD